MRQIISSLSTGETVLEEVPAPVVTAGEILVRTRVTLVSQGTEKMLVQFGRSSLLQKARAQPAKVRQVLQKVRTDGLLPTLEAVRRKLDEPLPLGYCNVGVVVAVGEGVTGFAIGDRVASNGPHAEFAAVPLNLAARIPDAVGDDAAAFTVMGAIGLQGIRLARPEFGETFVVVGLGLIGQMVAQLLRGHGCRVIGFDFDSTKVAMARDSGVAACQAGGEADVVKRVLTETGGVGADGVIITASTSSHDVIAEAAQMSRKRGRIVLVGVVGLNINRADFYEKELTFQVSCSYGPGRYELAYEEKGYDYPVGFVRWTENRNFQAVLDALATGVLNVAPLITRRVPFARYREVYDNFEGGGLASLLVYGDDGSVRDGSRERPTADAGEPGRAVSQPPRAKGGESTIRISERRFDATAGVLAVVGAGNFTKMTAMPALAEAKAPVKTVVSNGGLTGTSLAKRYGIPLSSTDLQTVLADPEVKGVIITTRHNLHAEQTVAAVKAGKYVLVEKPLCLNFAELETITEAVNAVRGTDGARTPWIAVGYNRRFSPHVEKMKSLLSASGAPVCIVATMNAGAIPLNHWVHDPQIGGGRLVGEACHFVDLAIHLAASEVVSVAATAVDGTTDSASVLLKHRNGSTSVVNYFPNGHRELSKERIEVHCEGRSLLLDNFRELSGFGFRSFSNLKTRQDKGHARQFSLFAERVRADGPPLIPWAEIVNSTRATLAIPRSLAERRVVDIG